MLWLLTNNIISLPPKWSSVMIAGPSVQGRDRHYVDGNVLLWDNVVSCHTLAKIAKNVLDPRSNQ